MFCTTQSRGQKKALVGLKIQKDELFLTDMTGAIVYTEWADTKPQAMIGVFFHTMDVEVLVVFTYGELWGGVTSRIIAEA